MMPVNSQAVRSMILRIAEFFRFMSDNQERRLYYVVPIQQNSPYAYQHSAIRDVATICDILDLVQFFKQQGLPLPPDSLILFEEVTRNTLQAYQGLYQKDELSSMPEGNIGDIGFFLLSLEKCFITFPSMLPDNWKETKTRLIKLLLERQRADGSISIFFDTDLKRYEKSSEAFYLPEALIGLIASLENNSKEIDEQVAAQVQKAIAYCCQDKNREHHLASDTATFYANWQFQLLYHWVHKKLSGKNMASMEANHLEKLVNALMGSRISKELFGANVAAVEVACYMEGLAHAQCTCKMLNIPVNIYGEWFEKEINRCLQFLYELQMENLHVVNGGFVHSRYSLEARIDVAGHVFSGLQLKTRLAP